MQQVTPSIPFNDLIPQIAEMRAELDAAIARVLDRGYFILGPECQTFERQFAEYLGVEHVIGVANGTEAIQVALMALGIGPGDEVICPALTAAPTALAILAAGAEPVLADVDPITLNLDPVSLGACLSDRTHAILPVHLYGLPANLPAIMDFAEAHGLHVVEDAAQAHGARIGDQPAGSIAPVACFSFYPTKNIGALGDGGALATSDSSLAVRIRQLHDLGQSGRYQHQLKGLNSRLDELQAAILQVKLAHLNAHNAARRERASWYNNLLKDIPDLTLPAEPPGYTSCYHLYVIRHPHRDALRDHLRASGIGSDIHYPRPLNDQPAFAGCRSAPGGTPVAARATSEILSLPLFPALTREQVETVAAALHDFPG